MKQQDDDEWDKGEIITDGWVMAKIETKSMLIFNNLYPKLSSDEMSKLSNIMRAEYYTRKNLATYQQDCSQQACCKLDNKS
jgi:hypothetical protein